MYPEQAIFFQEQWSYITNDVAPYIIKGGYLISSYGRIYSNITNKYLILTIDKDGYVLCCLHLKSPGYNSKTATKPDQKTFRVNRLVLATFAPVPGWQHLECNHKDSVRSNNYIHNLEWVTSKENHMHGLDFGYKVVPNITGINNPCSVFTDEQVYQIAEDVNTGKFKSIKDIAEHYGASETAIYSVLYKKHWSHLNYDIDLEMIPDGSKKFNKEEANKICKFFQDNNINSYPSKNELFRDCLRKTNLDNKFDLESTKKSLDKILRRNSRAYRFTIEKYDYKYI